MTLPRKLPLVGRIVGLWRYPVKSMAGEALTQAEVSWHGLVGDRRWAFLRNDVPQSGFPWFTLRQRRDLCHYQPSFTEPNRPDRSPTMVKTPSGELFEVTDPALGVELDPNGLRILRQDRGIFDAFPLSLITTSTLHQLGESVGLPLEVQRFRPNLLVETAEDSPFPEDAWVGSILHLGSLRMRVDKRDGRCVVITIDPKTQERNPAVLRSVAQDRQGCLGVYGSVVNPGRVALGDPVWLESPPSLTLDLRESAR